MSIGDGQMITFLPQPFVLATTCTFSSSFSVGVLGLGYNSSIQAMSLVENLEVSGHIQSAIFSLYLDNVGWNGKTTAKDQSILMIGDFDLQAYAETPSEGFTFHTPLPENDQWVFVMNEIHFDSRAYLDTSTVVIDPGTQYIYGPGNVVSAILGDIRSRHLCSYIDGFLSCSCSSINNNPDIIFYIDNEEYSISAAEYQQQIDGQCIVYIQQQANQQWVLGQIFLRKYYSVWSYESNQIGFIKSINNSKSSNNSSETWVIVLVALLIVLIFAVALGILAYAYKKKKTYRASMLLQPIEEATVN